MLITGARSVGPVVLDSTASMVRLFRKAEIASNDSVLRELYGNYCVTMQRAFNEIERREIEAGT